VPLATRYNWSVTERSITSLYEESNKTRLKQVLQEKAQVDLALEETEIEWMEISEQLETSEV
jgi:ATP-binding cassette subfamily F protein 3